MTASLTFPPNSEISISQYAFVTCLQKNKGVNHDGISMSQNQRRAFPTNNNA